MNYIEKNKILNIINVLSKIKTNASAASFKYNNEIISSNSISESFVKTSKYLNDKNNKTRENIIGAIINKQVPFREDDWLHLEKETNNYINELCGYKLYNNVECIHKGGRMYNYDFIFIFSYEDGTIEEFYIELKFNVLSIDDAPQFVSPTKPSRFMIHPDKISYEEYYYTNYLPKLLVAQPQEALEMPLKEEYMSKIHSNHPQCMIKYKYMYDNDITFYNLANELSRESIRTYIESSELDIGLLSYYLCETQKNKRYMLYNLENRNFTLQKVAMDDYQIVSVIKNAKKYRYECTSKSGKKINVLLRWKNGNGIAFPAFQISSKHKSVSNKSVSNKSVKCDSVQLY